MSRLSTLMVTLLASASSMTGVAFAQASTEPARATDNGVGIDEIVVTAQRVEEKAQRAAIAISVLKPEAIANATSTTDIGKLVPALQFGSAAGAAPLLYVRGVGTFSVTPYAESAVAVNYDGVYVARPTSSTGFFYDLDRIEVLKGPQGTLYGRNATGGALNIIPTKPRIGERTLDASFAAGNYNNINVQIAANMPLSDQTALRVAATTYSHDGYNSDGTFSEKGAGGRTQLLLQPDDSFSLRIAADYFHLGGSGPSAVLMSRVDSTGETVPLGAGRNVGMFDARSQAILNSPLVFAAAAGANWGDLAGRPSTDNNYFGISAELNWDLGFGQLTVLPAWRGADLNMLSLPGTFMITNDERDRQTSLEARLAGDIGPFSWLGGLYYMNEDVRANFLIHEPVFAVAQTSKSENKSYAAFGRLTWNMTDTFRFTGAARYTKDEKSFVGTERNVIAVCTTPNHLCPDIRRLGLNGSDLSAALAAIGYIQPPGSPVYVDVAGNSGIIWSPASISVDGVNKSDKVTYRVAAEYRPHARSLLYASFETGYRSGGFSFSSISPTYRPETIEAFTLGTKNSFFGNRLQLNIEAFHWKYKDQQISHSAYGRTGGLEFVTDNIGESTNKGVEVEMVARPVPRTLLSAVVQYLDAKNDRFVYDEVGTTPPATSCPATPDPASGTYRIDCSGLRALRSPKWTVNLNIQQTFNVSEDYKLVLEGNTHFQTRSIVMFERLPFGTQGSYWLSGLSVGFGSADDSWTLTAMVDNIENKRVLQGPVINGLNGVTSAIYGVPRTYGLRLKMHFGS